MRARFRNFWETGPVAGPDLDGCELLKGGFPGGHFKDDVREFSGIIWMQQTVEIFSGREKISRENFSRVKEKF